MGYVRVMIAVNIGGYELNTLPEFSADIQCVQLNVNSAKDWKTRWDNHQLQHCDHRGWGRSWQRLEDMAEGSIPDEESCT